ncbi:MAG: winged helix-turn-helix domain-containing protein [Enterobacteriaceae bacterium]
MPILILVTVMEMFLLDQKINFHPEERMLITQNNGQPQTFYLSKNESVLLDSLIKGVEKKEDLITSVWPERKGFISDSSFYKTVFMLRKSLCLAGLSKECIKTRSGYGLLFNVQVSTYIEPASIDEPNLPLSVERLTSETEVATTEIADKGYATPEQEKPVPLQEPARSGQFNLLSSVRLPQWLTGLSLVGALFFVSLYFATTPLPERNWVEIAQRDEQIFFALNTAKINTQKIVQRLEPILPDSQQKGHYYLVETPISQSLAFCPSETSVQPCENYISVGY